jgi:hypothetical protein
MRLNNDIINNELKEKLENIGIKKIEDFFEKDNEIIKKILQFISKEDFEEIKKQIIIKYCSNSITGDEILQYNQNDNYCISTGCEELILF